MASRGRSGNMSAGAMDRSRRGMVENGSSSAATGRSLGRPRLLVTPAATLETVTVATGVAPRLRTAAGAVGTPGTVPDARGWSMLQATTSGEAAKAMSTRLRDGLRKLKICLMKRTIPIKRPRARNFHYISPARIGQLVAAGPNLLASCRRQRSDAARHATGSGTECRVMGLPGCPRGPRAEPDSLPPRFGAAMPHLISIKSDIWNRGASNG